MGTQLLWFILTTDEDVLTAAQLLLLAFALFRVFISRACLVEAPETMKSIDRLLKNRLCEAQF